MSLFPEHWKVQNPGDVDSPCIGILYPHSILYHNQSTLCVINITCYEIGMKIKNRTVAMTYFLTLHLNNMLLNLYVSENIRPVRDDMTGENE
jgi:hypothetical protein